MNNNMGMFLKTLNIWNFRKYGTKGGLFAISEPGLTVNFQKGLNVLIGENNSGKTAIIDAIRYVLHTQSGEPIYLEEKDFYQDSANGRKRASELKIECIFSGLTNENAGKLIEWCSVNPSTNEYSFKIWLYAKIDNNRVIQYIRAGEDEGKYIDGLARDYLKVVYLKPLRDSLTDMTHGYKSRIAQILQNHTIFKKEKQADGSYKEHTLETDYKKLQNEIDIFFSEKEGKGLTDTLNNLLDNFLVVSSKKEMAAFHLTGNDLNDILRQLDLVLEENKSGLGSLNLLCIAAELLLFKDDHRGLRLTLIEELEAHLHPQYQLRLIDYIENNDDAGQFILTTHSTTVGSQIPLEKLIILKDFNAFPMDADSTMLKKSDYKFLQRFLDATKANLFFARGLIMVEGDAENLLIPTIAKIIDRPLNKYGVSIVNVGSTAYNRYVNIFKRKKNPYFGQPVSVVTDLDIPAIENYPNIKDMNKNPKYKDIHSQDDLDSQRDAVRKNRKKNFDNDEIKIFLPLQWTLEYEIASSCLGKCLEEAISLAGKEENKTFDFEEENKKWLEDTKDAWICEERNLQERYDTFKPLISSSNPVSKAITAQNLASILESLDEKIHEKLSKCIKNDKYLRYICDTIYHVTVLRN
jgi:putative ATP-dependent endonuclease of OLD family